MKWLYLLIFWAISFIFPGYIQPENMEVTYIPKAETLCAVPYVIEEHTLEHPVVPVAEETYDLTQEEIELVALVTMAEAEAEPVEGQRLVIDVILNRKDHYAFPDTIENVVWQKNQFECMWNGRTERCYVRDDLVALVKEELISRTNSEVVFFRTKHYSKYGVPLFRVGHHYFSKYE